MIFHYLPLLEPLIKRTLMRDRRRGENVNNNVRGGEDWTGLFLYLHNLKYSVCPFPEIKQIWASKVLEGCLYPSIYSIYCILYIFNYYIFNLYCLYLIIIILCI